MGTSQWRRIYFYRGKHLGFWKRRHRCQNILRASLVVVISSYVIGPCMHLFYFWSTREGNDHLSFENIAHQYLIRNLILGFSKDYLCILCKVLWWHIEQEKIVEIGRKSWAQKKNFTYNSWFFITFEKYIQILKSVNLEYTYFNFFFLFNFNHSLEFFIKSDPIKIIKIPINFF
jgi:hypothetical protein